MERGSNDSVADVDDRTGGSAERVERPGAIVVGASSGIGEALVRELASEGYEVGLTARRTERMREIGAELPTKAYVATMDVTDAEDAREGFYQLVDAMDSVDLVVISAGVGIENRDLEWAPERTTVDVNVRGFVAIATAAIHYFEERSNYRYKCNSGAADEHETHRGRETEHEAERTLTGNRDGHLVGISSVGSSFGNGAAPSYNASKAFVSRYLEGLRYRQAGRESDVTITTVEPGFVDTEMAGGEFWMCSPETAATQIVRAIRRNRRHVYVTRRWRLVDWILRAAPERLLGRLFT